MSETKSAPEPWKITEPDQNGLYGIWSMDGRHCVAEGLSLGDARLIVSLKARVKELEAELAKAEAIAIENHEAALCPEDMGCEEFIEHLKSKAAKAEAQRDGLLRAMNNAVEYMRTLITVDGSDEGWDEYERGKRDARNIAASLVSSIIAKAEGE